MLVYKEGIEMITSCSNCFTEFNTESGGTVCASCKEAFCPDCENKFFVMGGSMCHDCSYEDSDNEYYRVPKRSERIW